MMKRCLAALGVSSMSSMFLHQFVRALVSPMLATHRWLTFAGVSAASYGLTLALERASVTRALLLGSEKDVLQISAGLKREFSLEPAA